ncbi:MAG: AMIN domain-containing protein, partial [Pseudomonadota bacterium]
MNRTKRMTRTILLLIGTALLAGQTFATEVTDVRFSDQGDQLRFVLTTDGDPGEPTVFTTDQPPRIVLEMNDTSLSVPSGTTPVGIGAVQSYMAVSAGNRMRLMIDLSRSVAYELSTQGDSVILNVDSGVSSSQSMAAAAVSAASTSGASNRVENIDFRRGPDGQSRVIVDMSRPGVDISVDERAGQLRINLFGASLAENQMQRLDVADFATPVQLITPEPRGDGVRLALDIGGPYTHLAYQAERQLIIEVARPEAQVEVARELEFFQEREYTGRRVTLNFQDIAVRSVLQLIADISELNIVVSDSVTGNLTLRLANVPWDQALDIILETRNLDMRESGNVRWVAPTAEIAAREAQILQARAQLQEL